MPIESVKAYLEGKEKELHKVRGNIYGTEMNAPDEYGAFSIAIKALDYAGNETIIDGESNPALIVYTMWKPPKTDWGKNDKFNFDDYNRIKNNMKFVYEMATRLVKPFDIEEMGEDVTDYEDEIDFEKFNIFERNLETINNNSYKKDYGFSKKFYENGPFIDYEELNRIESAILDLFKTENTQMDSLRRIPFRFGAYREVRT